MSPLAGVQTNPRIPDLSTFLHYHSHFRRIEAVRPARSATRGSQPEEDEGNFDRRSWPLVPEGGLEWAFELPRIPRGTFCLDDDNVRPNEIYHLPRCVIIDAEDMFIKGTGYERRRIGNQQFDPACLFMWMRYLLRNNFMVVAVCSPAYLTPMQVMYPNLLKMLAQYGLMDFPLELMDPRNTYRITETAKRVGGIVLSSNNFAQHFGDPLVREIVKYHQVAPEYVYSRIKDTEWFYKTRDNLDWLAYHVPSFVDGQYADVRDRLFARTGTVYQLTKKMRKHWTPLRRDKLIAVIDYAIMERMKTPCAFAPKAQGSKSSKLRIQLMKELEMQLSVKRWRALLMEIKLTRKKEEAEIETKQEWINRMKNKAEAEKKRDLYRETEIERLRQQYKRRADRQKAEIERETYDMVEDMKEQVIKQLLCEIQRNPPPPIDYEGIYLRELETYHNIDINRPWLQRTPSNSVIFEWLPYRRNPVDYVELFFKWYNRKLRRQFKEKKPMSHKEALEYRNIGELPTDREMWPFERKHYIEHGDFFHGRRLRRGGDDWTRKAILAGDFDDLRVGPFMSAEEYPIF